MDTINQPVQSKAGKLSWSNMALKRCTSTAPSTFETESSFLWLPPCAQKFSYRDHTGAGALMCWVRRVCQWRSVQKIYRPSRSAYFSSLREAAISAAAPDSRAAALIYESASGHVTVTSQHSALPLDQGTSVRPSDRLPSDLNKPEGSLVTGKPAEEKARAIRSLKAWCIEVLPGALLHTKLWTPRTSTLEPQWHSCGTHKSKPSLLLLLSSSSSNTLLFCLLYKTAEIVRDATIRGHSRSSVVLIDAAYMTSC